MFCTHCEFEIKGDDRKECPVCGGPLIDYSEVNSSSEEITSALGTDLPEKMSNEASETTALDLGKAIEVDGDDPIQEPVESPPLSSLGDPESQAEAPGKDRSVKDAECTGFSKSAGESDRWEETLTAPKEKAPFDFGSALETDDEHPLQELEEPAPLLSQSETKLGPEAADTPRSTEVVVSETPERSRDLPGQVIAAAHQTALKPAHASRKQLAISVMAVLALVAAITTIAVFKPQQHLYQDIGHLKTKTEKTALKIVRMVTQREENNVVTQKRPEQGTRVQQRQRELAAENVDPDKKGSRFEKLSSEGKGKAATARQQLKDALFEPLPQQAAGHLAIASLQTTPSLPVEKDMQSFEMKPSSKNTLERQTGPATPLAQETSHNSLYSLHTGSFKDKEVAAGERDRLKKMGFQAYLQTVDLENGQTWHRIKVGRYSTREEAEKTQNELRKKVPTRNSYIMRRKTGPGKRAAE